MPGTENPALAVVEPDMNRRSILQGLAAAPGIMLPGWLAAETTPADIRRMRSGWRELRAEGLALPGPADEVSLTEQQWRARLTGAEYDVLRDEATEPAFSSPLNDEERPGLFLCAGCGLALFTSEMKFESGTGWPSFFTTIPDVFETKRDFVLLIPRREYHCARCGGHHGHIFNDGPPPTNERWCNNGVALRFVPADASL